MNGILVLGSNYGNRQENIINALAFIKTVCEVKSCSNIYESPDYKGTGNKYLNAVIEIECDITEENLNNLIKGYEKMAGRDHIRRERGEVPVDIDIVIWGGKIKRFHDYSATYFIKGFEEIKKGIMMTI